jgi:hypothetical protein
MHIQYVGFHHAFHSRIYAFHVIDSPTETREFTVQVESGAFRAGSLRFQDGPGVCFARLQREVEGETQGTRAEAHLRVGDQDVGAYRALHYPLKTTSRRKGSGDGPFS